MSQKNPDPYSKEGFDSSIKSAVEQSRHGLGLMQEDLYEAVPQRINAASETVTSGRNNTWIVLGRDRPASIGSGYGAQGVNGAGAIDICTGMMAGSRTGPQQSAHSNPNFASDAARIYISSRTDIDDNFALHPGKSENPKVDSTSTKNASGIGIKADGVRIIARSNGIKLVTGKGKFLSGGSEGERNANGQPILPGAAGPIELIAGNDTEAVNLSEILSPPIFEIVKLFWPAGAGGLPNKIEKLQPIPKGDNLVSCLKYMLNIIENLMIKINVLAGLFTEFLAAVPPALAPLPGAIALGIFNAINITRTLTEIILSTTPGAPIGIQAQIDGLQGSYLGPETALYINSRHCRTT